VLQSFRYVGCTTAEPKSIRSLMNFGTCSDPYTVTYAFLAVYSSSACHWLATEFSCVDGTFSSFASCCWMNGSLTLPKFSLLTG
jgi:hypothetical protein